MLRIPIALITIWHPETFWKMSLRELYALPALKKDRTEQELRKAEIAQQKNLEATTGIIHERKITRFGKPKYSLRRTWLNGSDIRGPVADYSIRLIDTEETGGQARFKVEARPNWGTEPHILPNDLVAKMQDTLSECKISVRQLWINPFTIDTSKVPEGPFYDLGQSANVAIGPYVEADSLRKAQIRFRKHPQTVFIHQHFPSYRSVLNTDDIKILAGCKLWWADYE